MDQYEQLNRPFYSQNGYQFSLPRKSYPNASTTENLPPLEAYQQRHPTFRPSIWSLTGEQPLANTLNHQPSNSCDIIPMDKKELFFIKFILPAICELGWQMQYREECGPPTLLTSYLFESPDHQMLLSFQQTCDCLNNRQELYQQVREIVNRNMQPKQQDEIPSRRVDTGLFQHHPPQPQLQPPRRGTKLSISDIDASLQRKRYQPEIVDLTTDETEDEVPHYLPSSIYQQRDPEVPRVSSSGGYWGTPQVEVEEPIRLLQRSQLVNSSTEAYQDLRQFHQTILYKILQEFFHRFDRTQISDRNLQYILARVGYNEDQLKRTLSRLYCDGNEEIWEIIKQKIVYHEMVQQDVSPQPEFPRHQEVVPARAVVVKEEVVPLKQEVLPPRETRPILSTRQSLPTRIERRGRPRKTPTMLMDNSTHEISKVMKRLVIQVEHKIREEKRIARQERKAMKQRQVRGRDELNTRPLKKPRRKSISSSDESLSSSSSKSLEEEEDEEDEEEEEEEEEEQPKSMRARDLKAFAENERLRQMQLSEIRWYLFSSFAHIGQFPCYLALALMTKQRSKFRSNLLKKIPTCETVKQSASWSYFQCTECHRWLHTCCYLSIPIDSPAPSLQLEKSPKCLNCTGNYQAHTRLLLREHLCSPKEQERAMTKPILIELVDLLESNSVKAEERTNFKKCKLKDCKRSARKNSKYCSHVCGMRYAKSQLKLTILKEITKNGGDQLDFNQVLTPLRR